MCRKRLCGCIPSPLDPETVIEQILRVHAAATALSPRYVLWLDGDGEDPEPMLPEPLLSRIRALVDEMDTLIAAPMQLVPSEQQEP